MPEIEKEIIQIAAHEDRSKSQIIEKLLQRGLAAFRRDGQLDDPRTIEIVDAEEIGADEVRPVAKRKPRKG